MAANTSTWLWHEAEACAIAACVPRGATLAGASTRARIRPAGTHTDTHSAAVACARGVPLDGTAFAGPARSSGTTARPAESGLNTLARGGDTRRLAGPKCRDWL